MKKPLTRSDIAGAYRLEVQRCTDITMHRIKKVKDTHTGGREAGMALLARIGGVHRAHLDTLQQAYEAALANVEEGA